MEEQIEQINRELRSLMAELKNQTADSDEYRKIRQSYVMLCEEKRKIIADAKRLNAAEEKFKADAKSKRIDNVINLISVVGTAMIGLTNVILLSGWIEQGYKFEQEGVVCSSTLKAGINRLTRR